mmetsp:Transcript_3183/g.5778  ORF Transcript_3183/g.5778 Transcript_3183/m.5778 type:complete len:529 (-) Transcript_3183:446-2032(-)
MTTKQLQQVLPMTEEEIAMEISILKAAVPKFQSKRPTEVEIAACRRIKNGIKQFLNALPSDQRCLFTTSGERVGSKKSQASNKAKQTRKKTRKYEQINLALEHDSPVDFVCVLDFEATCNSGGPAPRPQEIIEFPSLMLDVRSRSVISTFHHYIKPHVHPRLSDFCTELTGITQSTVDSGISLFQALVLHQEWLDNLGIVSALEKQVGVNPKKPTFLYLTCGDWDLKICLPRQLDYHNHQKVPRHFKGWINIKQAYRNVYGKKAGGMTSMLTHLGLDLEGRHHSGIDDCRNISRICARMLEDGWVPGRKLNFDKDSNVNATHLESVNPNIVNPKFANTGSICFSGGADGADILFDELATKHGHAIVHYGFRGMKSRTVFHTLAPEELQEADEPVRRASMFLRRKNPRKPYVRNLIKRNYFQVRAAERVYAVTRWNLKQGGDGLQTVEGQLGGGTGWAVAMAVILGVPEIFLYAIEKGKWYRYDYDGCRWEVVENTLVPRPEGRYAGIGSRHLGMQGEAVLRALYSQTS